MKVLKFTKEYASQELNKIPAGYINKTVCGCGLTTIALENDVDTVIAVPSVELIRNKVAQYPNSRSNNIILGVYGGVDVFDIAEYVLNTEVIKIMVTYDSLWKVEHLLEFSHLVIDESNKLLASSKLKASSKANSKQVDVVSQVFAIAERFKDTVSFISATPTPLEFMPTWVSTIDQITMEWAGTAKAKPILMDRTYPYKSIASEIIKPINDNGSIVLGGSTIEKVIVFMNSVNYIVKTIKSCGLDPKDVAIVASDSVNNDMKIKGYNRLQDPTNLPKFTFVTSSGFEGIDLVDDKAMSVVVSNTSKTYQMIDIMTDLKQAISRQRNKTNPNYGRFVYMYNQSIFSKTTEELTGDLDKLEKDIEGSIDIFTFSKDNDLTSSFEMLSNSSDDFKTYTNYNYTSDTYTMNNNMFNADRYFILNVREQYKKGFDIKGVYGSSDVVDAPAHIPAVSYNQVATHYILKQDFGNYKHLHGFVDVIETTVKLYGKVWTDIYYAKQMIDAYSDDYKQLTLQVQRSFKVGDAYNTTQVKDILNKVYKESGINRKAKATDLQEFMEVKNKRTSSARLIEIISKVRTVK